MSRSRAAVRIAIALVGIAAVAMAAATITSTIEPAGSDGHGGEETGSPIGIPQEEPAETALEVPAVVEYLLFALVILLAAVAAWYFIAHRRELVKTIAVVLAVSLLLAAIVYALLRSNLWESVPSPQPMEEPNESLGGQPGDGDDQRRQPFSVGPLVVLLAVLTAIFAGAIAWSDRNDRTAPREDDGVEPADAAEGSRAEVGAAAGRAAERIESSDDVDNEVYRAWLEMTRPLEVDRPDSSTPGEFAAAAVETGLAREDVDELTSLFESVRYGDRETTDERERRAVTVLRRIEAEYADADDRTDGETP
ncbi:DUF4129 domain-containing protein [Natrarchaeobius oligotrophus]|uniref:DUF4129 domain-containing protein n=1 Tax=Natrarchaeobius chitinivorans TaxID=1679083 RepID=A0A3N6MLW2_NATCH|nr:DUF4129 domain-containing protein [Natrarchaeobius chitinivorans]RQG98340.1 DUF4129 domain-containing protein [Natrarchaeobius chitinivorans]